MLEACATGSILLYSDPMDRKTFLKSLSAAFVWGSAASFSALSASGQTPDLRNLLDRGLGSASAVSSGVRRLPAGEGFHLFRKDIEPKYRVALGELVLVETQHGLPGRVTRDGKFRESRPDEPVNPMTGPIHVEGIRAGDALAIDILDILVGDWGYSGGKAEVDSR